MTESTRRESQDALIIEALATGQSYQRAGEIAGVSSRTVARRMADVGFARRVAERRGQQVVVVAGRVSTLTTAALAAIEETLHSVDPRIRLAASKLVLEWAMKLRRTEDLALEIAEIRQHLGLGSE